MKGCIYQRGRIWWVKYYHRGKPHYESTRSTDRRAAEKLLVKREIEAEQDKLPNVKAEKTKFDELAEDYIRDYRIHGKKSLQMAEGYVKVLKKHFGGCRAHDISTSAINRFIDQRKTEDFSNATINRTLAALKRMFTLGAKQTPPKVLRIPHIPMLRENNVRKGFFSHDEFLSLRSHLPAHLKGPVTLAYYTGMRKAEILGLRWDQVDLKEGVIRLEQEDTKTQEPRTIYVNDEVFRLLATQKRERDQQFPAMPFVFFTPQGEPIESFRKAWATACKKAGIVGRLFHDFRRTGVRNMLRAGVPERVAMAISGHRTRSIFDRYNITNENDLKLATQRVEAFTRAMTEVNPMKELEDLQEAPLQEWESRE